jgi:hypothetical protein
VTNRRRAPLSLRTIGVLLATGLAGTLFWLDIQADAETNLRRQTSIIEMKQTYRRQAALLTCWDYADFFGSRRSLPATTHFILPLRFRDRRFNLAAFDEIISNKQCKIETRPQYVDMALHQWLETHVHIERASLQLYAAEDTQVTILGTR